MRNLSWSDYGLLINEVWEQLNKNLISNKIRIDAVVAIMREGGFTALPLAYKLNTYKLIPIQYKYILKEGNGDKGLTKITSIPHLTYKLPDSPVFLLCDTFPYGGKTKLKVIADFRKKWKNAKFIFASIIEDKKICENKNVLFEIHAVSIDSTLKTTHHLFTNGDAVAVEDIIFPWENTGEEIASITNGNWDYN